MVQTELSATLGVSQDQTLITGVDKYSSDEKQQIEDFLKAVNMDARHQQDLIQSDLGVARTLAPGTHAAGSHLTKTLVTSCLNPWDVQSKHVQPEDGIAESLYSGECRYGGGESYVMQGCLNDQGGDVMNVSEDVTAALRAQEHGHQPLVYGISPYESNSMKSSNPHSGIYEARTSRTLDNNGGNPACNQGGMMVVAIGNGQVDQLKESDKVGALNCMHDQQAIITYGLDRASFNQGKNAQFDFCVEEELSAPIVARGPGGGSNR